MDIRRRRRRTPGASAFAEFERLDWSAPTAVGVDDLGKQRCAFRCWVGLDGRRWTSAAAGMLSRYSVQDRGGVDGDTDPVSVFQNPGIYKAFAANVGLAALSAFGSENAHGDGGLTMDVHSQGFGSNLLFVGTGRLHVGEKLFLSFQ